MKRTFALLIPVLTVFVLCGAASASDPQTASDTAVQPATPCGGTLASHSGDCKVVLYHYKDGYVPTGQFDEASFPQTKASDKSCGWQEDLVQGNAETPDRIDSPSYFRDHGWLVDSAQAPVGTPVCATVVTTTTTVPVTTTTQPTVVRGESVPAAPVAAAPKFTG